MGVEKASVEKASNTPHLSAVLVLAWHRLKDVDRRTSYSSSSRPPRRSQRPTRGATPRAAAPGRLPEIYYKRRRITAVLLLIAIGMGIMLASFWWNNTGTQSNVVAASTTAAPTSAMPAATSSQAPMSSETPTTSAVPTTSEAAPTSEVVAADAPACVLKDLEIVAQTSQPSFVDGASPVFYMSVKNPTEQECVIDLNKDVLRFEVYHLATNERIWSDIDCNAPEGTGVQIFKPGEVINYKATWSRTKSAPNSCDERPTVPSADYFLHAVIGDKPSVPVPFFIG